MNTIQYFSDQSDNVELPARCNDPFENAPPRLAILASEMLQQRLNQSTQLTHSLFAPEGGKMFGVLVVIDQSGKVGYLSGFSGMLNQQWLVPGFVPPVFDVHVQESILASGEQLIAQLTQDIETGQKSAERLNAISTLSDLEQSKSLEVIKLKKQLGENKRKRKAQRLSLLNDADQEKQLQDLSLQSQQDKRLVKQLKYDWNERLTLAQRALDDDFESNINELISQRRLLSQQLHQRVFENYQLMNADGGVKAIIELFDGKIPAGGAGDCSAPKLLQYAHRKKLKVVAMAEFWWGSPPLKGIRHHGHFYPPCRGRCHPILPFMLQGVDVVYEKEPEFETRLQPEIVYEDESLLVLNKPAGLLSIPGKGQAYSVLNWLREIFPMATGAMLVHRLDMATSGLLLAAKNAHAHKILQEQFIRRSIKKRYVTVLSKVITEKNRTIDLPLRVDLDDRPRQVVCYEHGKKAVSHVELISSNATSSRVYFYPVTGRTHQLRVHAAHCKGLNAPIVGDALYGEKSSRLLLHAEQLIFEHPDTGKLMEIHSRAPF